jgi:hypothetical protein
MTVDEADRDLPADEIIHGRTRALVGYSIGANHAVISVG